MRKKRTPAAEFGRQGGLTRAKRMTPEQRSAAARRAVNTRYGKTEPKPIWYGLVALPADYVWHGTEHAAKVLDEATSDTGKVVFWSQDKTEVIKKSQEPDYVDRTTIIIEQDWDPKSFRLVREYEPDTDAQLKGLRAVLDTDGGQS